MLFFILFSFRGLVVLRLDDFPVSEPIHIVAPIGATFFRQKAANLSESSKRPRV